MAVTENPTVSQVIAALEELIPGQPSPFMILDAPLANGAECNYFQVLAGDTDYCCEARIFDAADFRHGRAFLPDAEGGLGDKNERVRPNLTMAVRMISTFITNPDEFPVLEGVVWLDVSDEFH
ncbi:MAG: hypothetical protein RLZZ505_720 [Verrucomicrobiota bacterium]